MSRWNKPAKILKWPHPLLKKALPLDTSPVDQRWIDRMRWTMYLNQGLGLAANQVGYKRRVFVMRVPNGIERVFINPRITARSDDTDVQTEGCLSLPNQFFPVTRHLTVDLTCNNQGRLYTISLEGLEARVAQHELDHLDGLVLNQGDNIRLM